MYPVSRRTDEPRPLPAVIRCPCPPAGWRMLTMQRRHHLSVTLFAVLLAGCVTLDRPGPLPEMPWHLVDGAALFGTAVDADEAPARDVLEITPAMQSFVADSVAEGRLSVMRLKRLIRKLDDAGFFARLYTSTATYTAAETFAHQQGNCLSYTNLFVALAREARLQVHYQMVDVPPTWDADAGLLIRNNHINVVVSGVRFYDSNASTYTVDFNDVDPAPEFTRRRVSDAYALSLYYANRSVELLRAGEDRIAFAHLRRALLIAPGNMDLWLNLAAFYSRAGRTADAVALFAAVERAEPDNRTAQSGLARSYANLGKQALARQYEGKVRSYQQRNPYYHLAIAQHEYERADYVASLAAIEQAIALKRRNASFYFMKALAEDRLGRAEAARTSLAHARRLGDVSDLARRYLSTLDDISG